MESIDAVWWVRLTAQSTWIGGSCLVLLSAYNLLSLQSLGPSFATINTRLLVFSVVMILIGWGLSKHRNWARVLLLVIFWGGSGLSLIVLTLALIARASLITVVPTLCFLIAAGFGIRFWYSGPVRALFEK